MKWLKRAIRNWLGVNGDYSYPHRIVAMVNWRDTIMAVDGNGDIYELRQTFTNSDPIIQLMMKNPLER